MQRKIRDGACWITLQEQTQQAIEMRHVADDQNGPALPSQLVADPCRRIVGLQPKRAEVILAGACIVRTVLRKLRKDALTVSDRGLRHGLLIDRFGG